MVKAAATLALLSVALMCGAVSYSVVTVNKHLSSTLIKLDSEIDEAHRLTLEAGLTVMEARKASSEERSYLKTWNTQLSQTLEAATSTLQAAQTSIVSMSTVSNAAVSTLNTTQQTVASLQEPIRNAATTLTEAQKAISDLDVLITDPNIPATIAHTDATMSHLDATTKDVQDEVYRYTHPGIWTKIKGFALDIAKVFNPL